MEIKDTMFSSSVRSFLRRRPSLKSNFFISEAEKQPTLLREAFEKTPENFDIIESFGLNLKKGFLIFFLKGIWKFSLVFKLQKRDSIQTKLKNIKTMKNGSHFMKTRLRFLVLLIICLATVFFALKILSIFHKVRRLLHLWHSCSLKVSNSFKIHPKLRWRCCWICL